MREAIPARLTLRPVSVRPTFLAVLICLAFLAVWIWDLGYPSLSSDESFVAILTTRPAGEILRLLNTDEPHPPVYYLIMRAWHILAGSRPEFLVRYLSLLNGVLLLSLVYRLGRTIGLGQLAALSAVLFLGLNPQVTTHVREARMYGPMITGLAFAVLIGLRFERLPRRSAIGIAAVASLLALLTHYFNVLFVAALGLWGLMALTGAARRRWLVSQVIAWGAFALWLPLMGQGFFNPTSLSAGKTWSFTLLPWDTLGRLAVVGTFGYRDIPDVWPSVMGGALLVGGWLAGSLQAAKPWRWLLLGMVALPLGGYAVLVWVKPLYHPKYMLPWLLFAVLGLGSLVGRRRWLGLGVFFVLAAVMLSPTWRTIRLPYDPRFSMSPNEWLRPLPRQLSAYLVEHAGSRDVFGLGTPDAAHCYYSDVYFERSLGCALIPAYPTQTLEELEEQLEALLAEHEVLWYLDYHNPAWDPQRIAEAALARLALHLGPADANGNRLRLYASPATILRRQQAVGARFGEVAELEGVWIRRGTDLHIVLIWRALADRPHIGAKVFVHLLDVSGRLVAQADGVPVWWTRPLETWRLGEQLLDVYTLSLPEGIHLDEGKLRIGLYDPDTVTRLPARDQGGNRLPEDAASLPLVAWFPPASTADP